MPNVLCIIPARGGSKGIPRKNLRPMAGKPLIYYSIKACLGSRAVDRVVVSTDDEEIALFSRRFGAEVLMRPDSLADDVQTLDPVILHALRECESSANEHYELVLTVQPTSPLLSASEVDEALAMLGSGDLDTVLSVVDDRHLCWTVVDGAPVPAYTERVNRQFLAPRFRETGAIIGCRRQVLLETQTRIGERVGLLEIEQEKSFDIDTISDFMLCESLIQRKTIVFNVIGNQAVGMGHVYRALMLANELVGHRLVFVCDEADVLASQFVRDKNFQVETYLRGEAATTIAKIKPDLVINDILDTSAEFVEALKRAGAAVVNFEDLGAGIEKADLVVNALYPSSDSLNHVKTGPEYFCLREEFLHPPVVSTDSEANEVLLCFGGVDHANLTERVLQIIHPHCVNLGFRITVVLGPGYAHSESLEVALSQCDDELIEIVRTTPAISDYMKRATLAITSGGRTVFELAALRTPTMVLCQNEREQTHNFTHNRAGIVNLGLHEAVEDVEIGKAFLSLAAEPDVLQRMRESLSNSDFSSGKQRVMSLIRDVLDKADG